MVPEPQGEVAPPGEDGGGAARPQRVPRGIVAFEGGGGGFEPRAADGPVAVAAAALRPARVPQPPPDRLPQLPDAAGRGRAPQVKIDSVLLLIREVFGGSLLD